jgi:hypothetical protein
VAIAKVLLVESLKTYFLEPNDLRARVKEGLHSRAPYTSSVDSGQVSARCDKGVLKVNLAKKAEAKPAQIKVNVGNEKAVEAKVSAKARKTQEAVTEMGGGLSHLPLSSPPLHLGRGVLGPSA